MDRICLSVAIVPIAQEFGWSAGLQGIVQSAFLYGYMATQLLGGTLADRFGGKAVMACGVAWFSLASLLLPVALSAPVERAGLTVAAVLLARACVGLGEGVALPTMNHLVAAHVPPASRATALGTAFSGFHCGNLLGLALSPVLMAALGWRSLFLIFGAVGAPLLALWLAVVPARATRVEAATSARSSTLDLLGSSATWAIIVVNIVNHWGYFIYLSWMPSYFHQALHLDIKSSSFLAFLPWTVMAVGSSAAGLLADWLVRRGVPVTDVRKRIQTVAFLGPAAALLVLANRTISPALAVTCLTMALGTTSLGQAGFVANISDIAPRYAGQMFGLCNTFGTLAGIVGVSAVGFIVERTGSFDPVFKLTALLYVLGTVVWNIGCVGTKVFE
ncbi:hypothetical protein WJX81_004733 [Elliptochloris bilobata]|uniref:Major facilitator superfamily (MFS) profile domain-containing protein n=1 Tax=Elliptochloris bilobata TaxID=381761 RepID=A0AAW1SIS5_9CHLO